MYELIFNLELKLNFTVNFDAIAASYLRSLFIHNILRHNYTVRSWNNYNAKASKDT